MSETEMQFIGVGLLWAWTVFLWILSMRRFERYLMRHAEPHGRKPVCIQGQFFYILPASEYVHEYLQLRRVADSFNRADGHHENRNPQRR